MQSLALNTEVAFGLYGRHLEKSILRHNFAGNHLIETKINFINSGAVDIIRTAYYIRGLELMKLIFAVLDVSLTMGLTRCYKTEGFFYIYLR